MSCPYRHVLGVPGQGVHAARIGPYAYNDMVATVIVGILISYIVNYRLSDIDMKNIFTTLAPSSVWNYTLAYYVGGLFVLGEVLHYAFGTQTAFLTQIGVKAC